MTIIGSPKFRRMYSHMSEKRNNFIYRRKYLIGSITLLFFALVVSVLFSGHIDKSVNHLDRDAIEKLGIEEQCSYLTDFEKETTCIKAIQDSIRRLVTDFTCAARGVLIEPYQFIKRGYGCCYDRARFTEKALMHFGFKTRHVAIYDGDAYGLWGLLVPRINSHATTEVKTSRGWLGVDSNEPFLLITESGDVLTYRNFKSRRAEIRDPVAPDDFYGRDLIVVYGLYSRNGKFHSLNNPIPVPEFDLRELAYNLFPG